MQQKRFSFGHLRPKFIVGLAVPLCIIAFWWYDTNRDPQIIIPAPAVPPNPNGFDYFVKATEVCVLQSKAFRQQKEPVLDPLRKADFMRLYPTASRKTWLKQNAEALRLVRQGLNYESRWSSLMPWSRQHMKLLSLSSLLVTESRIHAASGDWNEAAQPALDAIHFGNATGQSSQTRAWSSSLRRVSSALQNLQELTEGLDAHTARKTARQLHELMAKRPPLAAAIEQDKWSNLQWYGNVFRCSDWRKQFAAVEVQDDASYLAMKTAFTGRQPGYSEKGRLWKNYFKSRSRMLSYSKRRLTANYIEVVDAAIITAKKPYRKTKPARGDDSFSDGWGNLYKRYSFYEAVVSAKSSLTEVAITLRAYKLEHGRYPDSLEQLVPNYLPAVPKDVFNSGKAIRYKRDGAIYKLWSVGPDGRDDGGKPIHDKSRGAILQNTVDDEDKNGDFVYGINR